MTPTLYHLATASGSSRLTDPNDKLLGNTYEDGLKVIPTYGVLPGLPFLANLHEVPGFDFDPAMNLHAGHDLKILSGLDERKRYDQRPDRDVFDKRKGALIVGEATSRNGAVAVLINRFSAFILGGCEAASGGDGFA